MARKAIFWMRRDLRLHDNHGLYEALTSGYEVVPIFIFDREILDVLPEQDARVTFIHDELADIKNELTSLGSDLRVYYGRPMDLWPSILSEYDDLDAVYTNHDYEPYATSRDEAIGKMLAESGIGWHTFQDHVLFERDDIQKNGGGVYTVFTPYKRKWLAHWESTYAHAQLNENGSLYPSEDHQGSYAKLEGMPMISLEAMSFGRSEISIPSRTVAQGVIRNYAEKRNFPGLENGTSKLGIHFRFGTISIRAKAYKAAKLSDTYLSELIWRDFYSQILSNFPKVVTESFKPKYDNIPWRDASEDLDKWKTGQTGYPIVDAGMRQLNETGWMHNRVRMITASFFTKHLLLDWRLGEAYFAEKLLDFELASNNGGWQWASGSGTDAAPYFRIFNPTSQLEKFDKQKTYVKRWVPEFGTPKYTSPMVDHKFARERCLETYKGALAN
ncbi:MAG: deoxyribodipyrimidine photo-lyase [Bacteroidota bacterium]